jgi:hypothetical protein
MLNTKILFGMLREVKWLTGLIELIKFYNVERKIK